MTDAQIKKWVEANKGASIAAGIAACKCGKRRFRRLRAACIPIGDTPATVTGKFSLNGKPLLASRPNDVWKGRFHSLARGMGYHIDQLAELWGASEDTVQSRARRYGCLRYVETEPGNYVACVVHPETAKGK
jgi:hypothetical protein